MVDEIDQADPNEDEPVGDDEEPTTTADPVDDTEVTDAP